MTSLNKNVNAGATARAVDTQRTTTNAPITVLRLCIWLLLLRENCCSPFISTKTHQQEVPRRLDLPGLHCEWGWGTRTCNRGFSLLPCGEAVNMKILPYHRRKFVLCCLHGAGELLRSITADLYDAAQARHMSEDALKAWLGCGNPRAPAQLTLATTRQGSVSGLAWPADDGALGHSRSRRSRRNAGRNRARLSRSVHSS